jgi:hypothetical protein
MARGYQPGQCALLRDQAVGGLVRTTRPEPSFAPVFGAAGFVGHIWRTVRGFRAVDANDIDLGTFDTADLAVRELLDHTLDETP